LDPPRHASFRVGPWSPSKGWAEVLCWADAIEARAISEGQTESVRSPVAAHRIRAHRALGNYAECLRQCEEMLPQLDHRCPIDHAIVSAVAGECLLRLGHPDKAAHLVTDDVITVNARALQVRWAIESALGNEEESSRLHDVYRTIVGTDPLAEEFARSMAPVGEARPAFGSN